MYSRTKAGPVGNPSMHEPLRPRFGGPHVTPSSFTVQPNRYATPSKFLPQNPVHIFRQPSACHFNGCGGPVFFLPVFPFPRFSNTHPNKAQFLFGQIRSSPNRSPAAVSNSLCYEPEVSKERRKEQRKIEDGKAENGRQKVRKIRMGNRAERKEKETTDSPSFRPLLTLLSLQRLTHVCRSTSVSFTLATT